MRTFTALLLSLVLAVASISMAVARGQAPMGATVELCTMYGTVTVALDADGNPLPTGPHLCPDCLSAATVFTFQEETAPLAPQVTSRPLTMTLTPSLRDGLARVMRHARDPPAFAV